MIRRTRVQTLLTAAAFVGTVIMAAPAMAVIVGDCNNDGETAINELQGCANIFLETQPVSQCPPCDRDGDGEVAIPELQGASNCFQDPDSITCPDVMGPTPTNTVPGNTPTNTPVTPTNTIPQATNTNTPVTPTATPVTPTNTIPQATNTNTPVTPTATPEPPTPTPTTESGGTLILPVEVLAGGGLSNSCINRVCIDSSVAGMACTNANMCKRCSNNPTMACTSNGQCGTGGTCVGSCQGMCNAGGLAGQPCASGADCNGCAKVPPVGSCAIVQNQLFPVRLPLNGVCFPRTSPPGDVPCVLDTDCPAGKTCKRTGFTMEITSQPDGSQSIHIPQESLFLPPALVTGIGTACVTAGGDGSGFIDCDGGDTGLDITLSIDHNTGPQVCLDGPMKGNACTSDANCPAANAACINMLCVGGTRNGLSCTSSANCPGGNAICNLANSGSANGLPDDPTCTRSFMAASGLVDYACIEGTRQCSGGDTPGKVCTMDADCPGGTCGGQCSTDSPHAGVCNSPTVGEIGGTFEPGDMRIVLSLAIAVLDGAQQFGADGLACTPDDILPAPPAAVPVVLSTGTNSIYVYDAGNTNGTRVSPSSNLPCTFDGGQCVAPELCRNVANNAVCGSGQTCVCKTMCGSNPCVAQIIGLPVDCPALSQMMTLEGTIVGGGFPAYDTAAGDIATTFQFTFE